MKPNRRTKPLRKPPPLINGGLTTAHTRQLAAGARSWALASDVPAVPLSQPSTAFAKELGPLLLADILSEL